LNGQVVAATTVGASAITATFVHADDLTHADTGMARGQGTVLDLSDFVTYTFLNGNTVEVTTVNAGSNLTFDFNRSTQQGISTDFGRGTFGADVGGTTFLNGQVLRAMGGTSVGLINHADVNVITNFSVTTNVLTVTTTTAHGLSVGQQVVFYLTSALSINNILFIVSSTPTPTTFTVTRVTSNFPTLGNSGREFATVAPFMSTAGVAATTAGGGGTGLLTPLDGPGPYTMIGGLFVGANMQNGTNAFIAANVCCVYFDEAI
jgi:hypothetical protein